jgi:hypothetical protein
MIINPHKRNPTSLAIKINMLGYLFWKNIEKQPQSSMGPLADLIIIAKRKANKSKDAEINDSKI